MIPQGSIAIPCLYNWARLDNTTTNNYLDTAEWRFTFITILFFRHRRGIEPRVGDKKEYRRDCPFNIEIMGSNGEVRWIGIKHGITKMYRTLYVYKEQNVSTGDWYANKQGIKFILVCLIFTTIKSPRHH